MILCVTNTICMFSNMNDVESIIIIEFIDVLPSSQVSIIFSLSQFFALPQNFARNIDPSATSSVTRHSCFY